MATKNITGFHDGSIVVSTSGNVYNIAANARVIATGGLMAPEPNGAIMEDSAAMPLPKNNIFNIDGRLIGSEVGIFTVGANDEIHVGATGKVSGVYGIAMSGNNSVATNSGDIVAIQGMGIFGSEGDKMHFTNNGDISGLIGIAAMNVDKALIVNGAHGDILALEYGVQIGSSTGETGKFINHGSVLASVSEGAVFAGGAGDETVVNDGKLQGRVALDDGNDTLDNRDGVVEGTIAGGLGDDTLITDKASDKLFENTSEGDDTVKSTVSYKLSDNVENLFLLGNADINGTGTLAADKLHGNNGDNTVTGLQGDDELWGGKGTDRLSGGMVADTFHFLTGDGHDTIGLFEQGSDLVNVSQWTGIDSFADVLSHAHDQGAGVKIELGTDSLLIANLHKADLTAADFIFPI